jgi:(p)ppGpp synthase/HD superfamily hydrolase
MPDDPASIPTCLTSRFVDAVTYATDLHLEQCRKGSGVPYVGHLLGVCSLVLEEGGSEDEAIAALLHDAAEDQGGEARLTDIRDRYGEQVESIVRACSDTLLDEKPEWRERKAEYLAHLEHQPRPVLLVSLADKLFNALAILRDHELVGEQLWTRFTGDRDGQLWYYRELTDAFRRLIPGARMTAELDRVVCELEQACASGSPAPPQ